MTAGTYISGSAHLILILWVVLGGVLFRAHAPEVFETADVSLLSAEEFAALQPNRAALDAAQNVTEPKAPATEDTPDTPAATDAPMIRPQGQKSPIRLIRTPRPSGPICRLRGLKLTTLHLIRHWPRTPKR